MNRTANRICVLTTCLVAAGVVVYLTARSHATHAADRHIDAFFRARMADDVSRLNPLLAHYRGDPEEARVLALRHADALNHFDYAAHKPELTFFLNKAKVDVSWHLSIVFSKESGGWHPALFVEHQDPERP